MRILTYTVTPEEDGRMVKGILRGSLQLSYTLLKSLKWRENAILLNGQSVPCQHNCPRGRHRQRRPQRAYAARGLVLRKCGKARHRLRGRRPARAQQACGVAMHPKSGDASAPSLAAMLTSYLGEGSVPHFVSRLDKGTSGLLIAAKSGYVHDRLRRARIQAICGASTALSPSAELNRRAASSTRRSAARRAPSSAAACAWTDFRASQSTRLCK